MSGSTSQNVSPTQQNLMARQLILYGGAGYPPALDMWQQLNPTVPANAGPGTVITAYVRNVGLVKRLVAEFAITIKAGATSTQTLTPWGLSNLISNVSFFDLGNNQRINTTGWHLTAISSAKRRRVFGASYTSDTPNGYGNNNTHVMSAPATLAANATATLYFMLEIPFTKNDTDLRGAIYADVTQATMQVQITLNPNMFVTSAADKTLAVYASGGGDLATIQSVSLQLNQNFLDQLPRNPKTGVPILPAMDIGTAYLLTNSSSGLPVVGQANAAAFVNARSYESVTFAYDNNGTLNVNGSDLTNIAITSANFTNILSMDGPMLSLRERVLLGDDFPDGMHYLDFRHRPIDTNQYGNMQLVLTPNNVGGNGAVFLYGWEAYGVIGLINQGGAIPSGGN